MTAALADIERKATARGVSVEEVLGWLDDVLDAVPARGTGGSGWTRDEVAVLARDGIDVDAPEWTGPTSVAPALLELIADALSTREAAELLGVTDSRVRQRIAARTLHAVRAGGAWRLPRWQFAGAGVVPGLGEVLPQVPVDLRPLSVRGFFTTEQPDLVIDGGAVTPRAWLLAGGAPARVAELAAALLDR